MHIEFLIEDQSGKIALDRIVPKLLRNHDTFKVHYYRGIGRIPKNLGNSSDPSKRILLTELPRLLRGYGKAFFQYPDECPAAVVVVCDLDSKDEKEFLGELEKILTQCKPAPVTAFCLAIEEGEAWLLGDRNAIKGAFPNAKDSVLNRYEQDSICGTWELLADAVYPGGAKSLQGKGWQAVGKEKCKWAEAISPKLVIEQNESPSFKNLTKKVRSLLA